MRLCFRNFDGVYSKFICVYVFCFFFFFMASLAPAMPFTSTRNIPESDANFIILACFNINSSVLFFFSRA